MQYHSKPMSAIIRVSDLIKGLTDIPDTNLWHYYPLWPGGMGSPLEDTQETIERLQEQGYELLHENSRTVAASLCFDLQETEKAGDKQYWARSAAVQDKIAENTPAISLLMTIDNCPPDNVTIIPMLNPLPLPQLGDSAFVFSVDQNNPSRLYRIEDLPDKAQRLKQELWQAIKILAEPLGWPAFGERLKIASDPTSLLAHMNHIKIQRSLVLPEERQGRLFFEEIAIRAAINHVGQLHRMLEKPDFYSRWQEIQKMAFHLAEEYGEYHGSQVSTPNIELESQAQALTAQQKSLFPNIETQKKKEKRQLRPVTPSPFDSQGYTEIVSAQSAQAIINGIHNAIAGADQWVFDKEKNEPPYFLYRKDAGQTIVEYKDDAAAPLVLWNEVKTFDDQAIDITLDVMIHLSMNMRNGAAWFFAPDHLDHREIAPIRKETPSGKRRRAGHRKEDMLTISRTLARLEKLWLIISQHINTEEIEIKGGKGKRKQRLYTHEGRFLVVLERWYQDELTGDEGTDLPSQHRMPIGWYIQAGDWLRTFLEAPNLQVAKLCRQLLKYDPYRQKWEKSLGIYLMFHGHMQCKGKAGSLKRNIQAILEEVSMPLGNEDNPLWTRKRFEKAMNKLVEDKVIDGWSYADETPLPRTQWLEHWLKWNVKMYIAPPQIQGS